MAGYIPVLHVSSSSNAVPDDSSLSTLPRGQVDYLSHQWEEEDVWRSWRNMTRRKHEIANGVRLENASWRTWWKQRNKLKTVSPETLNWLKDSDVTWLYGPLHTADDREPLPKPKPDPSSVGNDNSSHDQFDFSVGGKKPILKHRSISQLLTSDLPTPLFSPVESDDDEWISQSRNSPTNVLDVIHEGAVSEQSSKAMLGAAKRPRLLHTKSDTHITRFSRSSRRDSPPRIIASTVPADPSNSPHLEAGAESLAVASGSQHLPRCGTHPGNEFDGTAKKKHISFNTFVEQCIAIEKPKTWRSDSGSRTRSRTPGSSDAYEDASSQDDGYDEDSEDGFEDENENENENTDWGLHNNSDSDSDAENDDVLEMRSSFTSESSKTRKSTSTTNTRGSSSSRSSSGSSQQQKPRRRFRPSVRTPSTERDREHVTIAPIAPTILKTIGVGNGWDGDGLGDDYFDASDDGMGRWFTTSPGVIGGTANLERKRDGNTSVELVFVPPFGSNYSVKLEEGDASGEDIYHHPDAYMADGVGLRNSQIPSVGITPASPSRTTNAFFSQPLSAPSSPQAAFQRAASAVDITEEDAYDYFRGPDLGEDFPGRRGHTARRRSSEDVGGGAALRYGLGGSASGRASRQGDKTLCVSTSDDGERGRESTRSGSTSRSRSEERSRSRSRSRTPSPLFSSMPSATVPVPVPHVGSSHEQPAASPPTSNALLTPPLRGRTPNIGESQTRGRSSTRGSSFSDRERSGSRGRTSPLGSISPDGSIGIGAGIAAGRPGYTRGGAERSKDRSGADRVLNGSLSPDGDNNGRTKAVVANGRRPGRSESDPRSSRTPSSPLTTSPASYSPECAQPASPRSPVEDQYLVKPAPSIQIPQPMPKPDMESEEVRRSRQPTPANSPIVTTKASTPALSCSSPIRSTPKPPLKGKISLDGNGVLEAHAIVDREHAVDNGTIVGRAANIAGALLGVIWNGHA